MLLFNVLAAMPVMRIPRTAEAVSPIIGLIEFDIDMPSFIPFIILVVVRFERLDVINSTPSVKCYSVTIHGWGYESLLVRCFRLDLLFLGCLLPTLVVPLIPFSNIPILYVAFLKLTPF